MTETQEGPSFIIINSAGAGGFEPPNAGIKTLCLAAWRRPSVKFYRSTS